MTNEELATHLKLNFPEATIVFGTQYLEMTVSPESLVESAQKLKVAEATLFDYLICLTGVDYADCIGIVYHIESTKHHHTMVLKVKTENRTEPVLDTLTPVWHGAKYHEREVFDLLGVKFNNHIDLRRLFLEDGYGFPLRKDFIDEERIIAR
jgi:NADH:ubiquinone oxidoreductase subunit C